MRMMDGGWLGMIQNMMHQINLFTKQWIKNKLKLVPYFVRDPRDS